MRFILGVFWVLINFQTLNAQILYGTISDSLSKKTLAYANLSVLNSKYGTSTDSLGNFVLHLKKHPNDTLFISMLGYQSKTIALHPFLKDRNQLDILLSVANMDLDNVLLVYKKKKYSATKTLGVKRKKVKYKSSVPIGYERSIFIKNDTGKTGKVTSVSFKLKKTQSDIYDVYPVYFRIKFYKINKSTKGPGAAISFNDYVVKPLNKNQTITLEFENTFIPFLESGIFVSIETINPNPEKPLGSMYITTPNLLMTYDDEPLTYSSFRGQSWTHLKRKMRWKAFGKTRYYYANPLVEVTVQLEK